MTYQEPPRFKVGNSAIVLLVVLIVLLTVVPLWLLPDSSFRQADLPTADQTAVVQSSDQPPAVPSGDAQSNESNNLMDSIVLAVQVAIAAGATGYLLGYKHAQRKAYKSPSGPSD